MGPMGPMPGQQSKGLAIAALVCGILAIPLFCCCGGGIPFGIAGARPGALTLIVATLAVVTKVGVLATVVGAGEVFLAKLRLFRVPELLAGSFLLGLLAVGTSYFLSTAAT